MTGPLARPLFDVGRATGSRAAHDVELFFAPESVFPSSLPGAKLFKNALARPYDELARRFAGRI